MRVADYRRYQIIMRLYINSARNDMRICDLLYIVRLPPAYCQISIINIVINYQI